MNSELEKRISDLENSFRLYLELAEIQHEAHENKKNDIENLKFCIEELTKNQNLVSNVIVPSLLKGMDLFNEKVKNLKTK